jgi:hypothetical protein
MTIVQILIKKVPPVNSEVLVDLKNIESPVRTCYKSPLKPAFALVPTDKICWWSLSSLYILCAFGIQVWEFAFCYIMWI